MTARTRLAAAAAAALIAPTALVATAGAAQAVPDPGQMECNQPYVTHHQIDRNTVQVRFAAKRCQNMWQPNMIMEVKRSGRTIKYATKYCEDVICRKSFTFSDPRGDQRWRAEVLLQNPEQGHLGDDVSRWTH